MNEMTFEMEITDVAFGGNGLGRKDGFVYFVPGTLPGELVQVEEVSRKKNFGTAALVAVLRSSQNRIAAACPLAYAPSLNNKSSQGCNGCCPGCSYQHVKYEEEIRIKNGHLANFIRHNLKTDPSTVMESPVASPANLNYRNKIVMHFGEHCLGYFSTDNSSVVDVKECHLAVPGINAKLTEVRKELDKYSGCSDMTFRSTAKGHVHFWPDEQAGEGSFEEETPFGILEVPRGSFFQVNMGCAGPLAEEAAGMIKASKASNLADLYCGCGFFSIAAAKGGVEKVTGVDSDYLAVESAERNASRLLLAGKCGFYAKSAEVYMTENSRRLKTDDTVLLLDPPRGGLSLKLKNQIISTGVKKIIYISCAPDMMARDMKFLCGCGFALRKARMFDMFPRTPHFETIAFLEKN